LDKIEIKYLDSIESRIDRYLRFLYPLLTNGLLNKYLRKKYILLNNKKIDISYKVKKGDLVVVPAFFDELYLDIKEAQSHSGLAIKLSEKLLKDYLIFANNDFIVINKPNNLPTQGGVGIDLSIDHALSYLNRDNKEYRLVHRLDKETTGLLIIAANKDAARILTKAFRDRKIQKQYRAILYGKLDYESGWVVDGQYMKDFNPTDFKNYQTITKFQVLSRNGDNYHVQFNPITGKKHQLRIDASFLGAPVIGDEKYGGKTYKNLILHAENIILSKDLFGEELSFSSTPPRYFSID
jgi:23S rRNA pseudouridine955/2504/2580 synthase